MKNLFNLLAAVVLLGSIIQPASAETTENVEAKVLKVTGSAQVQLTSDAEAVPLTEGMSLPAGATIITGADSVVELRTLAGGQTSVQANTTASLDELSVDRDELGVITKQSATLSLRSGNLISTLDPKRKSINNYNVRTPKGVAAARGTVYAVSVSQTGTSVATLSGTVTLTPDDGGSPIVVDIATGIVIGQTDTSGNPVTLASLVQAEAAAGTAGGEGSITNAITQAVASVSAAAANPEVNSAALDSSEVATTAQRTSMLAAVVKVAAQANPTQAANYTTTAVSAAVASGNAASAVGIAEAAAQGAVQGSLEQNSTDADQGAAKAKAAAEAIVSAAKSAAGGSDDANGANIDQAVANGAATGTTTANRTTGNTVTAPTITVTPTDTGSTENPPTEIEADGESTPVIPFDPTLVSPSG